MESLSVLETLAGKRVLVTGASGFIGKVWLAMLLQRVPGIGRIYVLLRRNDFPSAEERLEAMIGSSVVFGPLRDLHGDRLGDFLAKRLEVVEGDVSLPEFGMTPSVATKLRQELDLVVNVAGLVDFDPDLRDALATNIDGALNAAALVESCAHAGLIHVSTCYVAGNRSGVFPERVQEGYRPAGGSLDPQEEVAYLRELACRVQTEHTGPEVEAHIRERVLREGASKPGQTPEQAVQRALKRGLHRAMVQAGKQRAAEHGWPNTYTFTKSIAEGLLVRRKGLRLAIFRPAIVESALEFPFPGWNEGFNASGPIVYLLGTWFRLYSARDSTLMDLVPVDLVCRALSIACAAVVRGSHEPVYQCGTSQRNQITAGRVVELSCLSHRQHLRSHGSTLLQRTLLSRWRPVIVGERGWLSIPGCRKVAETAEDALASLPNRLPTPAACHARKLARGAAGAAKAIRFADRVYSTFLPFIKHNQWVFVCRALDKHRVVEPEFRFRPESIDWKDYWLRVHVPGLRRWCFPRVEGKPVETNTQVSTLRIWTGRSDAAPEPVAIACE